MASDIVWDASTNALYVLGVQARVWSSDDDPRFEVTMNMALDPAQ